MKVSSKDWLYRLVKFLNYCLKFVYNLTLTSMLLSFPVHIWTTWFVELKLSCVKIVVNLKWWQYNFLEMNFRKSPKTPYYVDEFSHNHPHPPRYSLSRLKLDLNTIICTSECSHAVEDVNTIKRTVHAKYCNIFPTVEVKGKNYHLQLTANDLQKYEACVEKMLKCYTKRLVWLLQGLLLSIKQDYSNVGLTRVKPINPLGVIASFQKDWPGKNWPGLKVWGLLQVFWWICRVSDCCCKVSWLARTVEQNYRSL